MSSNNSINTSIGNQHGAYAIKSYGNENFFQKKPEDFDIPKIDLEFNNSSLVQASTFTRIS